MLRSMILTLLATLVLSQLAGARDRTVRTDLVAGR